LVEALDFDRWARWQFRETYKRDDVECVLIGIEDVVAMGAHSMPWGRASIRVSRRVLERLGRERDVEERANSEARKWLDVDGAKFFAEGLDRALRVLIPKKN
jgi:hypothetical protein